MLKKSLYTVLSAAFCTFAGICTHAQVINLPAANIIAQSQFTSTPPVTIGRVSTLLLGAGIYVAGPATGFPATPVSTLPSLPLGVMNVQTNAVGTINLGNSSAEVTLATAPRKIFTAAVIAGDDLSVNYKINTNAIIWQAGSYAGTLVYTADGATITPSTQAVTINVPSFLSTAIPTVPQVNLNVNNLSFFTNGISVNSQLTYNTSIPTSIKVKTSTANFTYTPNPTGITDPVTTVGKVAVALTGTVTGPTAALSTTDATISPASPGVPVTYAANTSLPVPTFTVTAADLKSFFVKAGTYDTNLTYTIAPFSGSAVTPVTITSSARVTVANLGAFSSTTSNINLNFTTRANYTSGVSTNVTGQLLLSSTVPYNITVKANTSTFSNGANTLPLNVLTISGVNAGDNIVTRTLSTTAQNLFSASQNPVIARSYDLKYTVAANAALLNKVAGAYSTTLVFTYTAP